VAEDVGSPTLGPYYYHHPATGCTFYDANHRLSGDIPTVNIGGLGPTVTPTSIGQVAIDEWNTSSIEGMPVTARFSRLATELRERAEYRETGTGTQFVVWPFDFVNPWFPFSGPRWVSGLTSGVAISVLLRAYQYTQSDTFLAVASLARNAFDVPAEDGGLTSEGPRGLFFEEVPSLPFSRILNGHLFGLFGLYDFFRVTGDSTAKALFARAVGDVASNLGRYSLRGWSYYDDPDVAWSGLAPAYYQLLHALQLEALSKITRIDVFSKTAEMWRAAATSRAARARYCVGRQYFRLRRRLFPPIMMPAGSEERSAITVSA
jgi:hypothetical protein